MNGPSRACLYPVLVLMPVFDLESFGACERSPKQDAPWALAFDFQELPDWTIREGADKARSKRCGSEIEFKRANKEALVGLLLWKLMGLTLT